MATQSGEDQTAASSALTCTRKLSRQATSRTAYRSETPAEDDPLLAFAPYLHPQPRSNSITPERQRAFVAHLAATGIVSQAARHIGKSMEALYKLRARPGAEGFAAAWDQAIERGVTRLEDCALERALQGTATPIVGREGILGWWDKPDNGLLRFLLQHRLPERYGVQQLKPGHPVYESIRAEVLEARRIEQDAEDEVNEAEMLAKFENDMRRFFQGNTAMRLRLEAEGEALARAEMGAELGLATPTVPDEERPA